MKLAEKVSKWIVIWTLLSLVLKCSATLMDVPRVGYGYEESGSSLEATRRHKV